MIWKKMMRNQRDPVAAQERAFLKLKAHLKGTEVAELYRLNQSTSLHEWMKNGRTLSYKDIQSSISQVIDEGKKDVFFKDDLQFVGLSSGTTLSNSKRILFNKKVFKNFKNYQLHLASILEKHTGIQILKDQRVTWGSGALKEHTPLGTPAGYVSGYLATQSPKITQKLSFPKRETYLIDDMNERVQRCARELEGTDIRLLSGVPTYLIHLLEELKTLWGIKNFSQVWPHCKTIVYSATGIEPYRERLQDILGQKLTFIGCYISTEGPIGYEIPSLNANQNGIYSFDFGDLVYSFKRIHPVTKAGDGPLLSVAQLKAGDEVEVFISSPNGLLHYSMGDCLRIRSAHPTILFEILGRVGQGLNVATEKASLKELEEAVVSSVQKVGAPLEHYFVYPGRSENQRPCYEWVLISKQDELLPISKLKDLLDQKMMEQNVDYLEARTDTHFLGAPNVKQMSHELIRAYFKRDSQRGQLKMKTVFNSKEEFEAFIKKLEPSSISEAA